jgi:transcriptional regulator with XRE-family HTH domain
VAIEAGPPDIRESFGFAVRPRRESLAMTQEDLAEAARIHRTYLSDVERSIRNLSLVNIERLALALRMTDSEIRSPGWFQIVWLTSTGIVSDCSVMFRQ